MVDALRAAGTDVTVEPDDFEPHLAEDRELICGKSRVRITMSALIVDALNRKASVTV